MRLWCVLLKHDKVMFAISDSVIVSSQVKSIRWYFIIPGIKTKCLLETNDIFQQLVVP